MTIIPKIRVSNGRKREKAELSFDCATTSNFGYVQPTMCREMLPNSTFKLKVASRVLLSGMPVPTFGRIYMRHTHCFVPYRDVCPQYDALMANQPYSPTTGVSFYPTELPSLMLQKISQYVLAKWADITAYKLTGDASINPIPMLIYKDNKVASLNIVKDMWDKVIYWNTPIPSNSFKFFNEIITPAFRVAAPALSPLFGGVERGITGDRMGRYLAGDYYISLDNSVESTDSRFDFSENFNTGRVYPNPDGSYVTLENADYISTFGTSTDRYLICFKLTPVGKRIRQILIGCGYQVSPNVPKDANWLKLLAFYKSWFSEFRPKRDISFTSTPCYNLIKLMENPETTVVDMLYNVSGGSSGTAGNSYAPRDIVQNFIDDLGLKCTYYLPMDYFAMSTKSPAENYQGSGDDISFVSSPITSDPDSISGQGVVIEEAGNPYNQSVYVNNNNYNNFGNPILQKLAQRVLKYVNKNTISGRSAANFIKAHFGVSLDPSHDIDKVYNIGESSTDIEISELMNTAQTAEMNLGEFAGRGKGGSLSEEFYFENGDMNGVWITLTTIVPKSGFYQGVLKENTARKKFDFFTPEFDAVGYQVLERSEVSLDYPVSLPTYNVADNNGVDGVNPDSAFGFVPRYSHLKVSQNIVNGDLSIRGLRNAMSGYTLDRMIPYDSMRQGYVDGELVNYVFKPNFKVTQVNDGFRRLDPTDHIGNYNRIFYYGRNDFDHFIINLVFDLKAEIPAISLQDSFDTVEGDEERSVEMTHA